jgi:Cu2+-exporting ATPase
MSDKHIFVCPMHPDVHSDRPGRCPKCGMKLVKSSKFPPKANQSLAEKVHSEKHEHHGEMHEGHERLFKRNFLISLPITLVILALSPMIQEWIGISFELPFHNLILFGLATFMVFVMGRPFYQMAKEEIRSRRYGMMTLVSLAVLAGYFFSVGATFFFPGESLYWEISTLVLAFLFGHFLEMRAVRGAEGALTELAKLTPKIAHLVKSTKSTGGIRSIKGDVIDVLTEGLRIGDIILIRPGEKIPTDARVIDGESFVNESMITGESAPVPKKKGDAVIGGTINTDGSLTAKITKTGEETVLSQMMELVRQAQGTKPPVQRLADRAASFLTFTALTVGIGTFLFWTFAGSQGAIFAGTAAIAVIVIACPHALGLAIPTVTIITTSIAARNGILIRDMKAIEIARKIDCVVFDKTGTLTLGRHGVTKVIPLGTNKEEDVLKLAASVEYYSQHPLGIAIIEEVKKRRIRIYPSESFKSYSGRGALGILDGSKIYVGNQTFLEEHKINAEGLAREAEKVEKGSTYIWVALRQAQGKPEVIGLIALEDLIRPESKEAVGTLAKMGIKTAMLTGDTKEVAEHVAKKLSIDTIFAQVLPEDKVNKVRELQKTGAVVAMVGDGVNDAPALTAANIGIAIGAGTGVAIESAQIILMKNDPRDVVRVIKLSRATGSKMLQNLLWAAGYNVLAIPAAAGVFYNFGILLRPEWSALLMSASSIIVVLNSFLLRREKL